MIPSPPIAEMLISKLDARSALSAEDKAALVELSFSVRTVSASTYLLREGQSPIRCGLLVEGYAYRQKLTPDGNREIVCLLLPGDLIDLQNIFLHQSDHDVQALTRVTVAEFNVQSLRTLVLSRPAIGRAMWVVTLIEAAIYREWLLNIGRRPAAVRLAHLLCELHIRLQGESSQRMPGFDLLMTQEQIGDALGLTAVHVNRVLKGLERDGLITRSGRRIEVVDWEALKGSAHFNERYLHLDQKRLTTDVPAAG